MSKRRRTTSPNLIKRNGREAAELAEILEKTLMSEVDQAKARSLARQLLLSERPQRRVEAQRKIQRIFGISDPDDFGSILVMCKVREMRKK